MIIGVHCAFYGNLNFYIFQKRFFPREAAPLILSLNSKQFLVVLVYTSFYIILRKNKWYSSPYLQ